MRYPFPFHLVSPLRHSYLPSSSFPTEFSSHYQVLKLPSSYNMPKFFFLSFFLQFLPRQEKGNHSVVKSYLTNRTKQIRWNRRKAKFGLQRTKKMKPQLTNTTWDLCKYLCTSAHICSLNWNGGLKTGILFSQRVNKRSWHFTKYPQAIRGRCQHDTSNMSTQELAQQKEIRLT